MRKAVILIALLIGAAVVTIPSPSVEKSSGKKETTHANEEQKTCPVMGGEIDKKIFVDYKGKRIYFCCPACVDEFKKNPEKYLKKM